MKENIVYFMLSTLKWNNVDEYQQVIWRKVSPPKCYANFYASYHEYHNIIQQLLKQFIPFLCHCRNEDLLVCWRLVLIIKLPPQSTPGIFYRVLIWKMHPAIRDVEYPRCLDSSEQQLFGDIMRCRSWNQVYQL